MNKIYLIGNGYVCNFITDEYSYDYEFIGVCRSEKNNCKYNYSIDISKCTDELDIVFRDKGDVVYLAAPQASGVEDHTLENFLSSVDKNKIKKSIYISTSGVYGARPRLKNQIHLVNYYYNRRLVEYLERRRTDVI